VNTDLYQSLVVALLAAITVLLIVAIAALARMRKTLESNGSLLSQMLPGQGASSPSPAPAAAEEALVSSAEEAGPSAAESPGTPVVEGSPTTAADGGDQAGAVAASPAATAEAVSPRPDDERTEERSAVPAGAHDDPEEEPFERDGRWWYRRGEELLVYDEQTGQWLQVQGQSSSWPAGYAGAAAAEQAAGTHAETRTGTIAEEQGARAEAVEASSSFWKCPSCGAINGATASSCRMCFAARP
jgi:hypothetical protein